MKKITTSLAILLIPFFSLAYGFNDDAALSKVNSSDSVVTSILSKKATGTNFRILQAILDAKKNSTYTGKGIIITKTNSSNAFKVITELEVLLKDKGYDILAHGGVSMPLRGFKIVEHINCFEIIIGVI